MDGIESVDKDIQRRFEVERKLGKGAYGIVWKAVDKSSKQIVALKKIFDAFQNATDAQRTYREIIFLKQMGSHENIIGLKNVFRADNDKDIYLVFEFMETDLHAAIRADILEDVHKQYIVYQSFKALKYMHSADLVHRDMKPANLLLNAECLMKVADFGLARSVMDENVGGEVEQPICTDYVATRWYRAPEILVGSTKYGKQVDMWSMGCILAEMLQSKPLFTGKTTLNQIEVIADRRYLGKPNAEDISSLKSQFAQSLFDSVSHVEAATPAVAQLHTTLPKPAGMLTPAGDSAASRQNGTTGAGASSAPAAKGTATGAGDSSAGSAGSSGGDDEGETSSQQTDDEREKAQLTRWREHFTKDDGERTASDEAVDLLHSLIAYQPDKRLTADQALTHAYCSVFHDASLVESFKQGTGKVNTMGYPDNVKRPVVEYRDKLYSLADPLGTAESRREAPHSRRHRAKEGRIKESKNGRDARE